MCLLLVLVPLIYFTKEPNKTKNKTKYKQKTHNKQKKTPPEHQTKTNHLPKKPYFKKIICLGFLNIVFNHKLHSETPLRFLLFAITFPLLLNFLECKCSVGKSDLLLLYPLQVLSEELHAAKDTSQHGALLHHDLLSWLRTAAAAKWGPFLYGGSNCWDLIF